MCTSGAARKCIVTKQYTYYTMNDGKEEIHHSEKLKEMPSINSPPLYFCCCFFRKNDLEQFMHVSSVYTK